MRARLLTLAVTALVAAGCGGGAGGKRAAPRQLDPGGTLSALVRAASAGDEAASRKLVTASSRSRLELRRLAASTRQLAGARVLLSERVDATWAVAALVKGRSAYAVPLRREAGSWKVELGDPIRLRPLLPFPGRFAFRADPQIAAEAKASSDLFGIALWLDGVDFSVEGGGPRPGFATAYGRAGRELGPGVHVVVAFARTGADAVATAWTFRVREPAS